MDRAWGKPREKGLARERAPEEISEGLRRAFNFVCPGTGDSGEPCAADFHWRRRVRVADNRRTRKPAFVKNPRSEHAKGCPHIRGPFKRYAPQDAVFEVDGRFCIDVGFAVSGHDRDVYPERHLPPGQRTSALKHPRFSSLPDMLDAVRTRFGTLEPHENPDLNRLFLRYQGEYRPYTDVWVSPHHGLGKMTHPPAREPSPYQFMVVKPLEEQPAEDGNRVYLCADMMLYGDGPPVRLTPVLTFKRPSLADSTARAAVQEGVIVITGRPRLTKGDAKQGPRLFLNVYIRNPRQIAPIDLRHWARERCPEDLPKLAAE